MDPAVTLIIFSAGSIGNDAERLVTQTRHAITTDLIARARALNLVERVIVATDSHALIETLQPYDVLADLDDPTLAFTFSARLAQIVERYDVQKAFYIGGGAGALLSDDELHAIVERLRASNNILVPNNFWSSDFVAFAPASAALDLPPLDTDNNLAFLLRTQRNLADAPLPRTVGTQFDVDTPTDVLLLTYGKNLGAHTRKFLDGAQLDTTHIERLLPHLTQRESELFVFGRVAGEVWQYFSTQIACRTRLLSEERGMIASGRETRGEARSLLGYLLDAYGVARALELLGELGTAALLDLRVLLAHRHIKASASDRFNADLLRPDLIDDDWLREFTRAVQSARMPIILGGHSLVCGGLYLLVEAAWRNFPPPQR